MVERLQLSRFLKLYGHNPIEAWLFVKNWIRLKTKEYSKQRASNKEVAISQLSKIVGKLERRIAQKYDPNISDLLIKSRVDIEELLEEKTKGAMFRMKANWQEFGERNSAYFFNLEKICYNARTCKKLIIEEKEITDVDCIMSEQQKFYQESYKEEQADDFDTELKNSPVRAEVV